MYVVVAQGGFIHQMIPLAKIDFDEIVKKDFTACPTYYLFYEGKLKVWPRPAKGFQVCELVGVEISE